MRTWRPLWLILVLGAGGALAWGQYRRAVAAGVHAVSARRTIADRVAEFGPRVHARLAPDFARVGVSSPPARATLIGLKAERQLEVWVAGTTGTWRRLRSCPILAASGTLGPKLREGDRQVPEGLYGVESLNPNSRFHLALRVNYPNARDRQRAAEDGRKHPGSDIMIHGSNCSIGCLAMGDEAAEDLFVLAAQAGIANVTILLSPVDFRVRELPPQMPPLPAWTPALYADIRRELADYRP